MFNTKQEREKAIGMININIVGKSTKLSKILFQKIKAKYYST